MNRKNKIFAVFSCAMVLFCVPRVYASTSLQASGYAGILGQYYLNMPANRADYDAFRVPIELILQASPTDSFSIFLGLDYGHYNYPESPSLLGGSQTTLPFSYSVSGSPSGEKINQLALTQAYFSYQNSFGLLRAGRMPRHWGLGIFKNAQWNIEGSAISTSDAVSLSEDFGLFDVSLYVEKYGESLTGFSGSNDATAYTVEARLKNNPNDPPSSGVVRDIGFMYSRFDHKHSSTSLNIIDVYGKFYFPNIFLGSEILFPTGTTQSPDYSDLGGSVACSATSGSDITCASQDISAVGALFKAKYLFLSQDNKLSLFGLEKSQQNSGTAERATTHAAELLIGYASGGSNQFKQSSGLDSNNISAIRLNPNIQPALLMFSNTMPLVNGMPTGAITNATFAKAAYVYENSGLGQITVSSITGFLNNKNQNQSCVPNTDPTRSNNLQCVGYSSNLGVEFDAKYSYTTLDRVTAAFEAGYWFVGDAWKDNSPSSEVKNSYGARVSLSTHF